MCTMCGESEMIYWRRSHDFEIVNLLDNGQTPKQVAMDLAISIWTVYRACKRFHVKQITPKQNPQKNAKNAKRHLLKSSVE